MSEQLPTRNVDRVFAVLDLDGDGRVEWADFEDKTSAISREFAVAPDAPEAVRLLAAYRRVWEYVRGAADTDRDDAVTREEFEQAHLAGRLSTAAVADLWATASDRCFELIDRDGDGRIDQGVLAALYRSAEVRDAEQTAAVAFAAMDANSDALVDQAEFTANVRGVFTATDESMKGAHMLGA
ncbi:EF-hand domain-containing protein [Saccharothrix australiensis]|uniref:Ca2+-binding EF-hand superfamily protein n=1 Tax=Saccharothrix australiensis TaxID=2072 RepID=A0A495VY20_9PSEU|nr:hypothetical protein [Saccharothrix australiensis]RKT53637.1 Ca2+-binding EF-hand superfamily protein [Saccharothrix australiensis]